MQGCLLSAGSALEQEVEKHHSNINTIMLVVDSIQRILGYLLGEHPQLCAHIDNIRNHRSRIFRMSLHGEKLPGGVHALNGTARRRAKRDDVRGIVVDDVLMHLLNALQTHP